jgi:Uma2 family endonuclease
MNMKPTTVLMNPDDLLAMPDGDKYELVNGIPVEKQMGAESGEITMALSAFLVAFVRQHKLGHAYDSQTGYQCFADNPNLVRKPDISFVARGRLPGDKSPKGHIKIAPDLAVEVVSPNDLYEEVEAKVNEFLAAGVKLVWVVSPGSKTVLVRRPDDTCSLLREAGELSGEGVVPGFTCKVAELFV